MQKQRKKLYLQQKKRYLQKIKGTTEKPRLSVFKSYQHIYAQLIDDTKAHTLSCSSTLDKTVIDLLQNVSSTTKEAAFLVGQNLANKAREKQISFVVFDRGNHPYHGRIASLAEGSRQGGLCF